MLHDTVGSRVIGKPGLVDRRDSPRVPFPAEAVIIWNHDLDSCLRYRLLDASDGGLRIRSQVPLMEGMTGMALKLLPEGKAIDKPVMVVWSRKVDDSDGYDIGLRCF